MANNKSFNQNADNNAMKAIKGAHRRKWTLIGAIFLLLVIIICIVIYHTIKTARENVIANQYAEIDSIYNQENLVYQQKIQEQKDNKSPTTAATIAAKIDPDYSTSMPKFRDFALKYPQDPYGWQAAIRSSTYFISNNKPEDAQKELEAVLPYTSNQDLVQIKIRTALAGVYASQSNTQKALDQLTIVENLPHNPLPNQSRFLKAQILVAAGNKADAKKVLNQIMSTPTDMLSPSQQPDSTVHQAKVYLNKIGL